MLKGNLGFFLPHLPQKTPNLLFCHDFSSYSSVLCAKVSKNYYLCII